MPILLFFAHLLDHLNLAQTHHPKLHQKPIPGLVSGLNKDWSPLPPTIVVTVLSFCVRLNGIRKKLFCSVRQS